MAAKLRVVNGGRAARNASVKPARKLGKHGAALWDTVMAEYEIADSGGLEMLLQAAAMLDRAETLRAQIERDGEVLPSKKYGIREHPCMRHELQARAFVVRTLQRLGLDVEAIKAPGRPSSHHGVSHEALDGD